MKIQLKAVSYYLKNVLGLVYLVDCSQTNDDAKQTERSDGLQVPQDCSKPKKGEGQGEMGEQSGN